MFWNLIQCVCWLSSTVNVSAANEQSRVDHDMNHRDSGLQRVCLNIRWLPFLPETRELEENSVMDEMHTTHAETLDETLQKAQQKHSLFNAVHQPMVRELNPSFSGFGRRIDNLLKVGAFESTERQVPTVLAQRAGAIVTTKLGIVYNEEGASISFLLHCTESLVGYPVIFELMVPRNKIDIKRINADGTGIIKLVKGAQNISIIWNKASGMGRTTGITVTTTSLQSPQITFYVGECSLRTLRYEGIWE